MRDDYSAASENCCRRALACAAYTLATTWSRLDKGGVADEIASWANSVAKPVLVVLDTLASIRPIRNSPGYAEDYEALAPLHRWANRKKALRFSFSITYAGGRDWLPMIR